MSEANLLIFKEAAKYHIPGYELEDLIQHGYLSVIKAISMYKLGSNSFNGYCITSIKMNFKALLKGQIKHFREVPSNEMLDFDTAGGYEFTLEDEVIVYKEIKIPYVELYICLVRDIGIEFFIFTHRCDCEGEITELDLLFSDRFRVVTFTLVGCDVSHLLKNLT